MPPSIVRRVHRGHVLLSNGWVARAPRSSVVHPTPVWPPRRSLRSNDLTDPIKGDLTDLIKGAAGSGVRIQF